MNLKKTLIRSGLLLAVIGEFLSLFLPWFLENKGGPIYWRLSCSIYWNLPPFSYCYSGLIYVGTCFLVVGLIAMIIGCALNK